MVSVPNRIFIDLGPVRESRGFRLLFAGEFVEVFGSQLTAVAIPYQVQIRADPVLSSRCGLVSLVQLLPLIAGALHRRLGWVTPSTGGASSWWRRCCSR